MSLTNLSAVITRAFEYIEANLADKITLDGIASAAGLSKFHLHRILTAVVNRPVMDFVRARKLTESLKMLDSGSFRVMDAAVGFSFGHEQSFARAFKKEFGLTPGAYRAGPVPVKATGRVIPLLYTSVSDGVLIRPVIEYRPELVLAGISAETDGKASRWDAGETCVMDGRFELCREKLGRGDIGTFYIVTRTKNIKEGYGEEIYALAAEDAGADASRLALPAGFVAETIRPGSYAVFKFIGMFGVKKLLKSQLDELWDYIFYSFFRRADFEAADSLRIVSIDSRTSGKDYCEAELLLPLARRIPHMV